MKKVEIEGVHINYYTNEKEWLDEFYSELPEGAIVADSPASAGFAVLNPDEIFIYRTPKSDFKDLLSTVSHELGHIITGGYECNPPDTEEFFDEHERKAEHYENFVMKAYTITKELIDLGADWEIVDELLLNKMGMWRSGALFPIISLSINNFTHIFKSANRGVWNLAERRSMKSKDVIWHDFSIVTRKDLEKALEELKIKL